jgi:hypothetical protein
MMHNQAKYFVYNTTYSINNATYPINGFVIFEYDHQWYQSSRNKKKKSMFHTANCDTWKGCIPTPFNMASLHSMKAIATLL